jgi:lysophospholipase L1-like esterase
MEKFLSVLRKTANVSEAARATNIARMSLYSRKQTDPEFSAAWNDAVDEASDKLEQEAWRRAVEGWEEPVFYQGEECGAVRKYSDRMLELLLKGHKPEKYRDRGDYRISGKDGGPAFGVMVVPGMCEPDEWVEDEGDSEGA